MTKTRIILVSLLCILALVVSVACTGPAATSPTAPTQSTPTTTQPAAQVIKWRVQSHNINENLGYGKYQVMFEKDIKELTQGRLDFTIGLPDSIVPTMESYQALSAGTLDALVVALPGYYSGILPEAYVEMGLPFVWPRMQDVWHGMWDYGLVNLLREAHAEKNIYYLTPVMVPLAYGILSKKPLNSLDDIKGMKIRSGTPAARDLITYFGAASTIVPTAEIYTATQTGVLDANHIGIVWAHNMKLTELAKNYTLGLDYGAIMVSVLINMDSWKKLPQDMRDIIGKYSTYIAAWHGIEYDETWLLSSKYVKEDKLTLTDWPLQDKQKMVKWASETYLPQVAAKSPRVAKMVDIIKTQMGDLSKMIFPNFVLK